MKTHLSEVHSEEYSDGSYTLGVLLNYSSEPQHEGWKESFVYMFRHTAESGGRYTFFNTMFELWSFMLYREDKMKRAYMSEEDYDALFDAPFIEGTFGEKLSWV